MRQNVVECSAFVIDELSHELGAVSANNKAMPYRHGLVYLDEEVIQLTALLKLLSQELGGDDPDRSRFSLHHSQHRAISGAELLV